MAISSYMKGAPRTRREKLRAAEQNQREANREVAERHLAEAFLILQERFPEAVEMKLTFERGSVPSLREAKAADGRVLLGYQPPIGGFGQLQTESELRHNVGGPAWRAYRNDPAAFDGADDWDPEAPRWVTVRLT